MPDQPPRPLADDLCRALAALGRGQRRWQEHWQHACPERAQLLADIIIWQEQLSYMALQVHRIEGHLHHLLTFPLTQRPWVENDQPQHDKQYRHWHQLLHDWWRHCPFDPVYLRVEDVLELGQEVITADIRSDIITLCMTIEQCQGPISSIDQRHPGPELEHHAYYHILGPWLGRGLPALHACQRWLYATAREHSDI